MKGLTGLLPVFPLLIWIFSPMVALAEDSARPPFTSGIVEVPQPAIYYEVAGEGEPLILIHGGLMDRRMWDPQIPLFAQHSKVIRYDVRGFGKSVAPAGAYSDVKDLLYLMDALKIERAILVGLSLGGSIAIDFTLEHPDRVRAIVPAASSLSGFSWDDPEGNRRFVRTVEAARDAGLEAATELWLKDPLMVPAMEHAEIAGKVKEICLDNARNWLQNPKWSRGLHPPAITRLQEINKPTLVIVGDRDVPNILKIASLLEKTVSGARRVTIQGAGHIINMEKPEEFSRAVLEFIHSLPR